MVNAEVDGVHADLKLDSVGFPEGTTIGFCGGIGYESGFGGGGQVRENYTMTPFGVGHINGMKDSRVAGFICDMPLLFMTGEAINETRLLVGYNRFTNMTDIYDRHTVRHADQLPDTRNVYASGRPVCHRHQQSGKYGSVWNQLAAQYL